MKLLLVISAFVAFAAAAPSAETELLSAFDFDALFANDKQREVTFDCLLDETPCGEIRQKFKDSVVKVIQNKCGDCTPEQKQKYDRVLKTFHDNYETVFNEFMKKMETKKQ